MLRGGLPGARWIDPENYHLTLRFIGDVDDDVAARSLLLGRVRRAPSSCGSRPRVVRRQEAARGGCDVRRRGADGSAGRERAALQRLGLEPEGRKFMPHVTLARLRELEPRCRGLSLRARLFRAPPFGSRGFVLFSSRDSVGGGPYVVEASYPFSAAA